MEERKEIGYEKARNGRKWGKREKGKEMEQGERRETKGCVNSLHTIE